MTNQEHSQVLIVDDDPPIRGQLCRAFASVGITCDSASDGEEALNLHRERSYKLVVTDLRMPKRHGHSLALALLDQPSAPIVVAVTGVQEPRLATDLRARGVVDIVYKPLNYFELAERLSQLLRMSPTMFDPGIVKSLDERSESVNETCIADQCSCVSEEAGACCADSNNEWIAFSLRWLDWSKLPDPPTGMQDVLEQIAEQPSHVSLSPRAEDREVLRETAVVIQLDDRFRPISEPFKVILRDLSKRGLGLVSEKRIPENPFAVIWRDGRIGEKIVTARPLRCRQFGRFYDIGAMILARLSSPTYRDKNNLII